MSCNNQIPYRNSQTLVVESPSPKSVEVAYFMAPLDDERKDCDTFLMALAQVLLSLKKVLSLRLIAIYFPLDILYIFLP